MHTNEAFLKRTDTAALMLEAVELGPKYVEALKEQIARLGV
jgi:hypothetical protein